MRCSALELRRHFTGGHHFAPKPHRSRTNTAVDLHRLSPYNSPKAPAPLPAQSHFQFRRWCNPPPVQSALIILPETTLLELTTGIPAACYRCGPVTLRRESLLRRYGPDRTVAQIYNDGHHNHHCPRCAGPIRLLIKWYDPDDRSREIPDDDE